MSHDIVTWLLPSNNYVCMYCRIITSIRGAPTEYGVEETKLKPFEKLLQTLEGKLMEGTIFRVCTQYF